MDPKHKVLTSDKKRQIPVGIAKQIQYETHEDLLLMNTTRISIIQLNNELCMLNWKTACCVSLP